MSDMQWPRLAAFKNIGSGIYQKCPESPIFLVKAGYKTIILSEIKNLELFCEILGLDYPPYFVEQNPVLHLQVGG